MSALRLSRRGLLRSTAALVVSFSVPLRSAGAQPAAGGKSVSPNAVEGFLAIDATGHVTAFAGKVDLGTGMQTTLMQIVAEELDLPLDRLTLVQGDTALTPDQGPTSGSLSVERGGMQLRHAAATARQALLARAATRLGAPAGALRIQDGTVFGPGGAQLGFGALVADGPVTMPIDPAAPLKPPADYKLVGRSVPRIDIPGKVTGGFVYMQDFRLPGMLHARVIRPPAIGATLQHVDEASVQALPGHVRVVRRGNFLAVVADTEWAAIKASQTLTATWSDTAILPDQATIYDYVRATKVVHDNVTSDVGDVDAALAGAAHRLSASYDFAIHTHGSIGPSCAVAQVVDGQVTCWTASQSVHTLRTQLAAMAGVPVANMRCIYLAGAGCYGRNGHEDAAADAVLLAQAVGQPVRVQWMRQDEHGWDPKGPPVVIDMQGGLDAAGHLAAWRGAFFYPDATSQNVPLLGGDLAGLPSDGQLNPGNIVNDSAVPYHVPAMRTVVHRLASTPLRPSWIRTPGRMQNTFANEAFFDELAAAAGADPLDLRVRLIDDPRGAEVLHRVAAMCGWHTRLAQPADGKTAIGRGLSYLYYELYRTYVAAVAEVVVDRTTGDLRVRRFYVAHDCGQIINPDGARNQIEGNVIQTVSRVVKEAVTFDRKMVTSLDWASYPILTFPEVPEVVIEMIDRPDTPPWGVGEATAAVVPAAIANAVHDAIGRRVRSVPITPDKIKQALQGA
ncbi:MAG: molybdopterin-dependent oxidoreductase [Acetobacteraceae bacterium]|nr:molybdopterin-dependent oxidoreductase [Acetobacteraceae bacterium]